MTKIVDNINGLKEGTDIIVSLVNDSKPIDVVLAKENDKIKAYDIDDYVGD